MTDSGFSSAASSRSAPSIAKASLLNSCERPQSNPCATSDKEHQHPVSGGLPGLPKPCAYTTVSGCNPVKSNRLQYVRSHGGYSPGIYSPGVYSPKESMSPMSSLAFDFRDLNTSREPAITPRKRLSLSSASGVDSPLASSLRNRSPSVFSATSAVNSPLLTECQPYDGAGSLAAARWIKPTGKQFFRPILVRRSQDASFRVIEKQSERRSRSPVSSTQHENAAEQIECSSEDCDVTLTGQGFRPIVKEGCFDVTSSPLSRRENEGGRSALRDRDDNVCDSATLKFRRFKSTPVMKTRCPVRTVSSSEAFGKENSPRFQPKKQIFVKNQFSADSPSPMRAMSPMATSPAPLCSTRPPSGLLSSPTTVSFPALPQFATSSSSAFSAVQQDRSHDDREPELRVSPRDGSSTPEKSAVPGSIASLSARSVMAPRPSSSVPFYRSRTSPCFPDDLASQQNRAIKRSLDSANTSLNAASSKRVKCSDSFCEARSSRRKMAFGSKERKTKSAEAAFMTSSPISGMKSGFRPISAPAQMLGNEEEAPLSHSRLCSSNDSDDSEGDNDVMMTSSELEHSETDEQMLEAMLSENARDQASNIMHTGQDIASAPSGLDGLITAPLLLDAGLRRNANDSIASERLPKPRELFRSPSAPPVVPSRRTLLALKRAEKQQCDTPPGVPRARSAIMHEALPEADPALCEAVANENEEDSSSSFLNRSRSFNELDVMKAVDLGCSDPNLVGDFSRVCSLPTVSGKEQDLKYITPETLIELMDDRYDCCFEVIDCRYPYEYEGGHIQGAHSVWQEQQMDKRFFQNSKPLWTRQTSGSYNPPVLVFYCEFSSERGPRMARALRSKDRELNHYPHLHYPELYVLKDGYKNFFSFRENRKFCDPPSYRRMTDEEFARELRMCRVKSKTWAGEKTKYYKRLNHA